MSKIYSTNSTAVSLDTKRMSANPQHSSTIFFLILKSLFLNSHTLTHYIPSHEADTNKNEGKYIAGVSIGKREIQMNIFSNTTRDLTLQRSQKRF